jgi:hypothetical protein
MGPWFRHARERCLDDDAGLVRYLGHVGEVLSRDRGLSSAIEAVRVRARANQEAKRALGWNPSSAR